MMKGPSITAIKRFISCLLLTLAAAAPAYALQFKTETGEPIVSFDTTISVGALWRMQGRDPSLIGVTNGGTSRTVNEDDGDLNYDNGDLVSLLARVTHDFEVRYRTYGMFIRGTYFYDQAAANKREDFGPAAEDRLVKEADLLDAYAWVAFDVTGRKLNLRAGRQVVNWGESSFIPNGINIINPVDVTKLRSPGAELKEALLPTPMGWLSQELTSSTTLEAVYLTSWEKTKIDPRGSFFSSNDYASDDGDKAYVGFGRRNDQHFPPTSPLTDPEASVWIPRSPDRNPSHSGQYGAALRQFAPGLNNTEFGFYYLHYHSRTPVASGTRGSSSNLLAAGTARYFIEYPENINLYGASFNTPGPAGIALQGEYSYRPNQPLQLAAIEVLLAGLGQANNITGDAAAAVAVPVGTEISGYRRVRMQQAQVTATKAFGPTLGAEQFSLVGEVGYTYLDLPDGLLFNGPAANLPAPGSANAAFSSYQEAGYATKNSWGYRLLGRMDFENAVGPATLSPRIAFSHDVNGVSPTFNERVKAITAGLGYNLRQVWQADIAYTSFFGGRTYSGTDTTTPAFPAGQSAAYASSANPLKDRDFLSMSVSYSF